MPKRRNADRKRNRGFEETHAALIETAVRMLGERGAESLTVSALAREMGLNRTTVYYHFPHREAMLEAVKDWSSIQIARGMAVDSPQLARIEHIVHFVLANPELMKQWIDEFLAPGDIAERYTPWNDFVAGMRKTAANGGAEGTDPEVYTVMMLTAALIGPRVFRNSVGPDTPIEEIGRRFVAELRRQLRRDRMLHD